MASETVGYEIAGEGIDRSGKQVVIVVGAIIEGGGDKPTWLEELFKPAADAIRAAARQFDVPEDGLTITSMRNRILPDDDIYAMGVTLQAIDP